MKELNNRIFLLTVNNNGCPEKDNITIVTKDVFKTWSGCGPITCAITALDEVLLQITWYILEPYTKSNIYWWGTKRVTSTKWKTPNE